MAQIEIDNIIEYQKFRRNPGPLLTRAAEGRPLLVLKGDKRLVVVDAASYSDLVRRAALAGASPQAVELEDKAGGHPRSPGRGAPLHPYPAGREEGAP